MLDHPLDYVRLLNIGLGAFFVALSLLRTKKLFQHADIQTVYMHIGIVGLMVSLVAASAIAFGLQTKPTVGLFLLWPPMGFLIVARLLPDPTTGWRGVLWLGRCVDWVLSLNVKR